jgi:hypothetical protein
MTESIAPPKGIAASGILSRLPLRDPVDFGPGKKKHPFFRNRGTNPGRAFIPAEWPVQRLSMQLARQEGSQEQI